MATRTGHNHARLQVTGGVDWLLKGTPGEFGRQHAAPGARYYRLQPHLPERIGPFESDEAKLVAMEEHTRNHFRQSSLAAELCSRLVESVRPQETVRDLNAMVPFRGGAEKMGKRTAVVEEPGVPSSFVEPRCFVELEQDGQ